MITYRLAFLVTLLEPQYLDARNASASVEIDAAPVHRSLVFRHCSKTGGTFMRLLLPHIIKDSRGEVRRFTPAGDWRSSVWEVHDNLRVVIDRIPWPLNLRTQAHFKIAVMRHPLSWYLSYYGYLPYQALHHAHPIFSRAQISSMTTTIPFEVWLRNLTLSVEVGYFSYRFWTAYIAPPKCYAISYSRALSTMPKDSTRVNSYSSCTIDQAAQDLHNFRVDDGALDCWMRMENLESTLKDCLAAWNSLAVDWSALRHSFDNSSNLAHSLVDSVGRKKNKRRIGRFADECSRHFSAPGQEAGASNQISLSKLIMTADHVLFKAFKYSPACGGTGTSI